MMRIRTKEKLDVFIKCLGFRLSLNEGLYQIIQTWKVSRKKFNCKYSFEIDAEQREADSDAILLLANIKMENYVNEDRHIGFDVTTAMFILKVINWLTWHSEQYNHSFN